MKEPLFLDLETCVPRSHDVKKVGAYKHAEAAEITLFSYAVGHDAPVHVWDRTRTRTQAWPAELASALADPERPVVAHNAPFDRAVLREALGTVVDLSRWRCTAALARTCALPAKLSDLGAALGFPEGEAKIKDGQRLIQKFAFRTKKGRIPAWKDDPQDWSRFVEYARRDTEVMRRIWYLLPHWIYSGPELAVYKLDQEINDRGMLIDLDLARCAVEAVKAAGRQLDADCAALTEKAVGSPRQVGALLSWIAGFGVSLPALDKASVDAALKDSLLPRPVKRALLLRQQSAKASASKFEAALRRTGVDGRLRGSQVYYGAKRTGRQTGDGLQPQNLPSRGVGDEAAAVNALLNGTVDLLYESPMHAASAAVRGLIHAPPGCLLECADLANIEGRMLAWLADETWKLDAFRAFDRKAGPDLYVLAFARAFGIDPAAVGKHERSIGKVMELALGYQGGVNAFLNMASGFGFKPADLVGPVLAAATQGARFAAHDEYMRAAHEDRDFGLRADEYMALAIIRTAWRDAHRRVVNLWREMETKAQAAIRSPGDAFRAGRVVLQVRECQGNPWLTIKLPSGRLLMYFRPGLSGDDGRRATITFWGETPTTRKWEVQTTFGGRLTENITQASARDVLAGGMLRADRAGLPIILTVHDEIVAERCPGNAAPPLADLMSVVPAVFKGLPLAATGFRAPRYRK